MLEVGLLTIDLLPEYLVAPSRPPILGEAGFKFLQNWGARG